MATPGWQPRPVQATAAPMAGFWGAPGTVNQSQGPPMRPPFGPPPNYPSPQSGAIPPYGTANQPSLTTGNAPLRPASAPVGTQGGPYAIPPASQPSLNYGSSPNTFSGNRWPVQAAPAPTAVGVRPHASGGPPASPGMLPASSGAPQAGVVAVAPIQGPPYQGFPIGAGLGSPQQVVPPWIQPGQNFQRPPYVQYTGNFQGAFPGQQIRHMGPSSEGMPGGAPPGAVGPPFGVSSDPSLFQGGQLPLAWGQGHPGGPAARPTAATSQGDLGSLNGNYDLDKAGPAAPGGKESAGSASALKSDKGSSQLAAEPADAWTAHKTEDGTVYYYNSVSGQSTYTQPEGFTGEADKVTTQPTPVSWERLSGIDWALVTTNDGKKYYYNTRTQATSWQVPPEVAEIRKKEDDSPAKPAADAVTTVGLAAEKSPVSFTLNVPAAITGGREAIGHKVLAANSALDLIKKKLQDAGAPATSTSSSGNTSGVAIAGNGAVVVDVSNGKGAAVEGGKEKPHKGDHASSDESSESDEEDPGPSKEQKIMEFKEMLKEKGVAPFSKWEKELPKVIFDPRFKAIPSHTERRAIFEHYVRTRADVERREKRAAQKAAVEGFKQLLEEAAKEISHTTTHDNFAKTWGHDPRFEALERKDRESLLNESNSIKVNPDPLCDVAEAICGIRVGPLRKAEEEKVRAEHAAAVTGFRALLLEKGEISSSSRWSKTKESLRSDSRYKVVKRDEREELFNAIIAELRAAELEVEKAAKAKKEEEEKLKERDREARKRKEREEIEVERVRVKARRKDAVTAYQALLTERIKDPEASWTEARSKLDKDPSGRASNSDLDLAEKERVFREHVDELYNRCVREFRALLADVITAESAAKQGEEGKTIVTSWSEAKKVLKPDPRYSKMPRREREALWRRYAEDVQRRLKAAAAANKEENHLSSSAKAATPTRVATDVRMRSPGSRRSRR